MKKFSIIDFQGEYGLETSIVPSIWIQMATGQCYWPNEGDSKRAVIDCSVPMDSWSLYPFTAIKYETDEYPKAVAKLKLLLQGYSDVGSSTSDGGHQGNRRKRLIQRKRWMSSSDSDEDQTVFSAKPSKRSCVNENEPPRCLPKLHFTPHPSTVAPRAASRLRPVVQPYGMLPQPRTPQQLPARSRPGRPALNMCPVPVTLSPNMSGSLYSSEDYTDFGSGSLNSTSLLLNRILKKIEKQSKVLQNVVHKLNEITLLLQNAREGVNGTTAMLEGLSLPLTNEQEIGWLEEKLMEKEFRTKLVQHLSGIGGDSTASLTRRILKRLFSPELATNYNFTGARGKKSFQSLMLRSILIAAVRKAFAATSEVEVDDLTRRWFGNARDLDGGRTRRAMSSYGS